MVSAIDVSLDRVDRLGATQQLILTSQLVGSIDTLSSLLVLFGRIVPRMQRFATGGRRHLAKLRIDAKRMRSVAFAELFEEAEPPDVASAEEQPAPVPEPEPEPEPPRQELAVIDVASQPTNE